MPYIRSRPRKNVPFEKLMIEPHQVKAFYGVENESQVHDISNANVTEKRESTNYNFNITDDPLWRTIAASSQERTVTNYNFNVTDAPLCRTFAGQTTPADTVYSLTPNYVEEVNESRTTYSLQATSSNEKPESATEYDFHLTDNTLWRTMNARESVEPESSDTSSHEKRESTKYNFHMTDDPLWRTQADGQITPSTGSPTCNNLTPTYEPSYHRTVVDEIEENARQSVEPESSNLNTSEKHDSTTKYNFHMTDDELWRTQADGQITSSIGSDASTDSIPTRKSIDKTVIEENNQSIEPNQAEENSQQTHERVSFHFMTPTQASMGKSKNVSSNCKRSVERPIVNNSQVPVRLNCRQSVEAFTQTSGNANNRRRTVLQMMHEKSPGLPRRSLFLPPPANFQRRFTNLAPFFNRLSSGSDKSGSERASVGSNTSNSDFPKEPTPKSKIPLRSPRSLPSPKQASSSPRLLDRVLVKEAFKSVNGTPLSSKIPVSSSPKTSEVSIFEKSVSEDEIQESSILEKSVSEDEIQESSILEKSVSEDEIQESSVEKTVSEEEIELSDEENEKTLTVSENEADSTAVEIDERPQIVHLTKALEQIGIDYKTPDRSQAKNKGRIVDYSIVTSTPTRSGFFNSLFGTKEAKSGVIPVEHPKLNPNAQPKILFNFGDTLNESIDDGPSSQKIASQPPPAGRKPLSLLNDDDFGSPAPRPKLPKPSMDKMIPNNSRFYGSNDTTMNIALDETAGVSVVSGNSDLDSDLGSPAPKHIVLRAKPNKSSPYMFVRPPKIVTSSAQNVEEQRPDLRRSKRTRFHRQLVCGEKPIYERDENGDYNIVGVSSGYTADPLCKKFNTFDKDIAMERQKQEKQRKKRVRQQNRDQREELNQKYLD